jgi:hypothetical protein
LDEAEEVISDFADGNDYNPSNELDALEHDPDWDEVEDTLNEEENMQAEKFIPPAEIGLSEETIEEMHKLDDFIVNHKEEFAAEKTYIESDLDSDILLDELEGKHLITIKNDEDEDEIL